MTFTPKQQAQYRPLVDRAWKAHCMRTGIDKKSVFLKQEWYRCTLLDACGIYTTTASRGPEDYDKVMLAFAQIAGDEKLIDYWSRAPERRELYLIDRCLKKMDMVPGSPAATAYIAGIMRHMGLDQLCYGDLPAEHLHKIFIALSKQVSRDRKKQ